jgi:hypothetical protein
VHIFASLKSICLLLCVAGFFFTGCSTTPTITLSAARRTPDYDKTKLIDHADDGSDIEGHFINIDSNGSKRLLFAFDTIDDSGVDMELTSNGVVVWRMYVQPLGVLHFKYEQDVFVRILDGKIRLTSIGKGGFSYLTKGGEWGPPPKDRIIEIRSLESGELISRTVDYAPRY